MMRFPLRLLVISAMVAFLAIIPTPARAEADITVPDPAFGACIADALGVEVRTSFTAEELSSITELQCNSRGSARITSLDGWDHLVNVERFRLSGQQLVGKVIVPATWTKLTWLMIHNSNMTSIEIPESLTGLTFLNLSQNALTDITLPETLTALQSLSLSYNPLSSIRIPETLTGLKILSLRNPEASSMTIPATLTSLESLTVGSERITTLAIPATLRSLRVLELTSPSLTSVNLPDALTNLEELTLFQLPVDTVVIPATYVRLSKLTVSYTDITNFAIPDTLTALTEVSVTDNELTQISLPSLPKLQSLDLQYNRFTSFTVQNGLPSLAYLNLVRNRLTGFTVPSGLTNLRELHLGVNRLTSLTVSPNLTRLDSLHLSHNHLSRLDLPRTLNPSYVFLQGNRFTDVSGLGWMPAGVVNATAQLLPLPDATVGVRYPITFRDLQGKPVYITARAGATVTNDSVTYTAAGTHQLDFGNPGTSLSGRLTQKALGRSVTFGDHTGDKVGDLFAVDQSGQLQFFQGSTTDPMSHQGVRGTGWGSMTHLAQMDDLDGDQHTDLLARRGHDHSLWAYRGQAGGSVTAWKQLGRNWGGMDQIVPAGNMSRGSTQYVVARRADDGALFSYELTAHGLTGIKQIGQNWQGMRQILSVGDLNGDGRSDLLAIRHDGTLWSYLGTPQGTIAAGKQVGHGWDSFVRALGAGDLSGDGVRDLVGQRADGAVFAYANKHGSWGLARQIMTGAQDYRLMS